MAKAISKEDVQAAVDKAVVKATAAETKRCVAVVKASSAALLEGEVSKDFAKGIKSATAAAAAAIKA